MTHYNLDKLVKITVNNLKHSERYCYKKELKIFGILIRKAGIYYKVWKDYLGPYTPLNHTIIDGKLFENPEVVLRFVDGSEKTFYFKSLEDAQEFAEHIKIKPNNFINDEYNLVYKYFAT